MNKSLGKQMKPFTFKKHNRKRLCLNKPQKHASSKDNEKKFPEKIKYKIFDYKNLLDEYIASANTESDFKNENSTNPEDLKQMSEILNNNKTNIGDIVTIRNSPKGTEQNTIIYVAEESDDKIQLKPEIVVNKDNVKAKKMSPNRHILEMEKDQSHSDKNQVHVFDKRFTQRFSPYADNRNKSTPHSMVAAANQKSIIENNVQLLQNMFNKNSQPNPSKNAPPKITLNGQNGSILILESTPGSNAGTQSTEISNVTGTQNTNNQHFDLKSLLGQSVNTSNPLPTPTTNGVNVNNDGFSGFRVSQLRSGDSCLNGDSGMHKNPVTTDPYAELNALRTAQASETNVHEAAKIQLYQQLLAMQKRNSTLKAGETNVNEATNTQLYQQLLAMHKQNSTLNAQSSFAADVEKNKIRDPLANNDNGMANTLKQKSFAEKINILHQMLIEKNSSAPLNSSAGQRLNNNQNTDLNSLLSQTFNARNTAVSKESSTNLNALQALLSSNTGSGGLNAYPNTLATGGIAGFNSWQGSLAVGLTNSGGGLNLTPNSITDSMMGLNMAGLTSMQSSLTAGNFNFNTLPNNPVNMQASNAGIASVPNPVNMLLNQMQATNAGIASVLNSYNVNAQLSNNASLMYSLSNAQQAGASNPIMSMAPQNMFNQNYLANNLGQLQTLNSMNVASNDVFSLPNNGNSYNGGISFPANNSGDMVNFNNDGSKKVLDRGRRGFKNN